MFKGKKLLTFSTNTLYQLLSRAISAISGLIIVRVFIGLGGIDIYGDYQTIVVYTSFFWIITDFGLNALFVRDIKKDEKNTEYLYSINLTMRVIIGLLLTLVAIIGSFFLHYSPAITTAILIGSTTIFFQSVFGANTVIFQSKLEYKFYFLSQSIGSVINLIITIILISYTQSLAIVILGYTLGNAVLMLVGLFFVKRYVRIQLSTDFSKMWRYFLMTLPVGLSLFFSLGITKIDALLLSSIQLHGINNSEAVGTYLLAYKIFELVTLIAILSMNTLYPILSEYFAQKRYEHIQDIVKKALIGMFSLSIFVAISTYLGIDFIYSILAPEASVETISAVKNILSILILVLPLFYITPIPMYGMIIMNRQKYLIFIYFTGFVFNLVLNLIFIPQYNYYAAAIITGFTELLLLLLLGIIGIKSWRSIKLQA